MPGLSHEFKELKGMIVRYTVVLLVVFVGILVFPVDGASFATRLFLSAKDSLIPAGIPVVAMGPVSSFVAPIVMAFLVAILATFPLGVVLAVRFLGPALRPKERRTLYSYVFPSLGLFYAGCALAYLVIIPTTFHTLYSFSEPIGVAPIFALDDFVSSVFFLTISVGVAFLLPMVMIALSRIGFVPGALWFRHFRGAALSVLILSAIITPDGSGVTMTLLSVPLVGLYLSGAIVANRRVV